MERALGVQWCIQSDTFQFHIALKDCPCTRREFLSTINSIFDPLGFIAPVLLEGKSILQDLCRNGVNWTTQCCEFVCLKCQVVCSLNRTQGCRKHQQGYFFQMNAVIPHKTSQQAHDRLVNYPSTSITLV